MRPITTLIFTLTVALPSWAAEVPNIFQPGQVITANEMNSNFSSLADAISFLESEVGVVGRGSAGEINCDEFDDLQGAIDGLVSGQRNLQVKGSCQSERIDVANNTHLLISLEPGASLKIESLNVYRGGMLRVEGGTLTLGQLYVAGLSGVSLGKSDGKVYFTPRVNNVPFPYGGIGVTTNSYADLSVDGCGDGASFVLFPVSVWNNSQLDLELRDDLSACMNQTDQFIQVSESSLVNLQDPGGTWQGRIGAATNSRVTYRADAGNSSALSFSASGYSSLHVKGSCGSMSLDSSTAVWYNQADCESASLGLNNAKASVVGKLTAVNYDSDSELTNLTAPNADPSAPPDLDLSGTVFTKTGSGHTEINLLPVD